MNRKTYRSVEELVTSEKAAYTSPQQLRANFRAIAADAAQRFGPHVSLRRGHPAKGTKATGTVGKTVKHTAEFWKRMAVKAKARGLTLHEAMRQALGEWVEHR